MDCAAHHDCNFRVNRSSGYDCYLFLYLKTPALFNIGGLEMNVDARSYVLYKPFTPHFYSCLGDEYINDWMQFDADSLPSGVLSDVPVFLGDSVNISEYMRLVSEAFYRGNNRGYSYIIKAMFSEIAFVSGNSALQGSHYSELAQLRRDLYNHPEKKWIIKDAANEIHISEAYLQELYKKTFGIAFGQDVIKSRVEAAKELLSFTSMGAAEIGYKCGYNSPEHFSRQFSKAVGISPSEWRRTGGQEFQNLKSIKTNQ